MTLPHRANHPRRDERGAAEHEHVCAPIVGLELHGRVSGRAANGAGHEHADSRAVARRAHDCVRARQDDGERRRENAQQSGHRLPSARGDQYQAREAGNERDDHNRVTARRHPLPNARHFKGHPKHGKHVRPTRRDDVVRDRQAGVWQNQQDGFVRRDDHGRDRTAGGVAMSKTANTGAWGCQWL